MTRPFDAVRRAKVYPLVYVRLPVPLCHLFFIAFVSVMACCMFALSLLSDGFAVICHFWLLMKCDSDYKKKNLRFETHNLTTL